MFDSEYIPGVMRLEAGKGVVITYRINSDNEAVWTTEIDSDYISTIVQKAGNETSPLDSDYVINYIENSLNSLDLSGKVDSDYIISYVDNVVNNIQFPDYQIDSEYLSRTIQGSIDKIQFPEASIDSEQVRVLVQEYLTGIDSDLFSFSQQQVEYLLARRITSHLDLLSGSTIIFNGIDEQKGIAYDSATGIITLEAGKTYELSSSISHQADFAIATWVNYGFYDVTNSEYIGSMALAESLNSTNASSAQTLATAIVTPLTDIQVKLIADEVFNTAEIFRLRPDYSWLKVKTVVNNTSVTEIIQQKVIEAVSASSLVDSDWIENKIASIIHPDPEADSDWILRQIANIDIPQTGPDSEWIANQISNIDIPQTGPDSEWIIDYVNLKTNVVPIDSDLLAYYVNKSLSNIGLAPQDIENLQDDIANIKEILGIATTPPVEEPVIVPSEEILSGYILYDQNTATLSKNLVINIIVESFTGDYVVDTDLFISSGTKKDSILQLVLYKIKTSNVAKTYFEYLHYNTTNKSLDYRFYPQFVNFNIIIKTIQATDGAKFTIVKA